ncbi:MAG: hydantoinase/oxoprolinase family protein [Firmicutes bacterium]|nr:hydantoinase/oxoprolinase family protein [Bacillota bacterium]
MYFIGIDVGGTFTDCVAIDKNGKSVIVKSPTTHGRLLEGIFNAIHLAAESFDTDGQTLLQELSQLCHGTTISTNTLLSKSGAKTGLITTKGHRDALLMMRVGRLTHPPKFGLQFDRPEPLVKRRHIKEVSERIDYKGSVVSPLIEADVIQAVDELAAEGIQAVAVSLLWAFINPVHEQAIQRIIEQRHPEIHVTLSSELAPFIGEYERTSTTVVNSYVALRLRSYLKNFSGTLSERGMEVSPLIMQATGGLLPLQLSMESPITTINSGPVGGAIACRELGKLTGQPNLLGVDMGGTSFDIALIVDGMTTVTLASKFAGYDISIPFVDVHSIGAGGGSIARVDVAGRLKVGPESAESEPGPACYDKGGTEPTVTDADVLLGLINPEYYVAGRFALKKELAEKAIREKIAAPLGMDAIEAANGILKVVNSSMVDAMRTRTIQRGLDPREFTMVAFGGCGATHASFLAPDLGIRKILVPYSDTAFSANGVLGADILRSFSVTDIFQPPFDADTFNRVFNQLDQEGRKLFTGVGIKEEILDFMHFVEMRYRGQFYSLEIPMPPRALTSADLEKALDDFEDLYERFYGTGTRFREAGIIATRLRSDCIGKLATPAMQLNGRGKSGIGRSYASRKVYFDGWADTAIYRFEDLLIGKEHEGPAIVEKTGSTVVVRPGQRFSLDEHYNLAIEM